MQTLLSPDNNFRELDQYLAQYQQIFLVCSGSFRRLTVGAHLKELEGQGRILLRSFCGFSPNPSWEEVQSGTALFQASGCGLIAAVGGGSAIDTAKCIRYTAGSHVPLLAIPTTAGSGSEATHFAVVYRQGVKESVDCGLPEAVLMDPSALDTLPDYQRKATMLDALCHGVESFWSKKATAESREYSGQAIRRIMDSYAGYLQNTPEGNAGMMKGAHLAGKAINLAQTTAGHAMCYQITKLHGLAHGHAAALCVARLWPYVLDHAAASTESGLRQTLEAIADAMGCGSSREGAERFQNILTRMELKVPACTEQELAGLTASVNPARLNNFPISLTEREIQTLYQEILKGR